jgi:hypothetical protein
VVGGITGIPVYCDSLHLRYAVSVRSKNTDIQRFKDKVKGTNQRKFKSKTVDNLTLAGLEKSTRPFESTSKFRCRASGFFLPLVRRNE